MKVSIIIPNWNGRKLLEKNLPAVLAAKPDEVVVVDDASPDDSDEFLKKNYPEVKIVRHQRNLGFAASCNDGVKVAIGEVVALLNLDVVPEKDFLQYVLPNFKDSKIFAVSFHEPNWSRARIFWKHGFIEHEPGAKSEQVHISAWASGGSAAFRRAMWTELGGFDEIYKPFYWEDIDLGYRAWKRGWKILWEPKAVVHHEHETIIGKHFSKTYIDFVSRRNQLIFIWKNISSPKMILEHKFWLLVRLATSIGYWRPFLGALLLAPKILVRRIFQWQKANLSDRKIFDQFK